MICNTIGLTSDSFETLYVRGGAEVPEVYGSINYAQPVFYSLKTLTGATSYSFMGYSEPLKSYEISGNMVQSGTPTPESPINPQECGDRTENLFDINSPLLYNASIAAGERNVFPYAIGDDRRCIFIPVEPNTAYTFSCRTAGDKLVIAAYNQRYTKAQLDLYTINNRLNSDGSIINDIEQGYALYTFTTSATTKMIGIYYQKQISPTDIMLNAGSTALPYEPYGQHKIPLNLNGTNQNIYLSEPLRKIGNYADSINSDGTVTRRIQKLVLTGTEYFQKNDGASENYLYYASTNLILSGSISRTPLFCNELRVRTGAPLSVIGINTDNPFNVIYVNFGAAIMNAQQSGNTVEGLKEYLAAQYAAGTPVTIWYVLATPTTEQVTAPTLTPATGNNTLSIGTTLQPSSVSITGHVKPSS